MKKFRLVALSLACALMVGCTSKAQKEKEQAEKVYAVTLNTATTQMLTGAAVSEKVCNLTSKVWHNAIYDKTNAETIKFMKDANGDSKIDFNDALSNLYANEDMISITDSLKENKEKVEITMSDLANPPEKYAACYATISDLYKSYTKFTSHAITPTGSYIDYNNKFSELDDEFMSTYNLVKTQLPDISDIKTSE